MASTKAKDERIDVRLSSAHKDALLRAASLLGLSLTDFIVSRSLEAANDVLCNCSVITMSPRDVDRFLAALDEDSEPNDSLKKAAARYKGKVREGSITE